MRKASWGLVNIGAGQRTLVAQRGCERLLGGSSTLRLVNARLLSTTWVRKASWGLVNIEAGQRTLVVHNVGAKGFLGARPHWGWSTHACCPQRGCERLLGGSSTLRLVNARLLSTTWVRKASWGLVNIEAGQRTLVAQRGCERLLGGSSTLRLVNARLLSTTWVRKASWGLVNIEAGQRTLVVHNVGAKGFLGARQH